MEKLRKFREGLFEIIKDFPTEKQKLFEPFVSFGDPFQAKIFFVGANGVLDGKSRDMLRFLDYWSDEEGFLFYPWHSALARQKKGLSKTRRFADKMIALLDENGYKNQVLSTNVFSIGSARLADLEKDNRSVAPFQYLMENLNPELLFVFGLDARKSFFHLWPGQIETGKSEIEGITPFQINLKGKIIKGIFTKHLSYQTGDHHLPEYVSELLRLKNKTIKVINNQSFGQKSVKIMENQKEKKATGKVEYEKEFQEALNLFKNQWVGNEILKIPSNSPGNSFQVLSPEAKRVSIPILNAAGGERSLSLDATQEFFFDRLWPKKNPKYDKNSKYADLSYCGGFAKYLIKLLENQGK